MMITDTTGNELSRDATGIKIRLARTFKRNGQSMLEFNAEIKALPDKDLQDLADWYTADGYPTTVKVA